MKSVIVNGVTLHYEVVGEGRPVVLVHGNGEDHHHQNPAGKSLST